MALLGLGVGRLLLQHEVFDHFECFSSLMVKLLVVALVLQFLGFIVAMDIVTLSCYLVFWYHAGFGWLLLVALMDGVMFQVSLVVIADHFCDL